MFRLNSIKFLPFFILSIFLSISLYSCGDDDSTPLDGNLPSQVKLTVTITGTGGGTITDGAELECDDNVCTKNYVPNTMVTLAALPDSGSTFSGWSGCDSTNDDDYECDIAMDNNKTVDVALNTSTDPLDSWVKRESGTTSDLRGITYASNIFIAAGNDGTILTSPDGEDWTASDSGTVSDLYGLTHGNGIFTVASISGSVLTSSDGFAWTNRDTGNYSYLFDIDFGRGLFVAVGDERTILTSYNGTVWTSRSQPSLERFYGVTSGGNTYVTVGNYPTAKGGAGIIFTSTDGITWSQPQDLDIIFISDFFSQTFNAVTYGNTVYVTAGYGNEEGEYFGIRGLLLTSHDTITWTQQPLGTKHQLEGIYYGDNVFVAVGENGNIFTSSDGTNWQRNTSGTTETLYDVTFGNNSFVTVGKNGTILQSYQIE